MQIEHCVIVSTATTCKTFQKWDVKNQGSIVKSCTCSFGDWKMRESIKSK